MTEEKCLHYWVTRPPRMHGRLRVICQSCGKEEILTNKNKQEQELDENYCSESIDNKHGFTIRDGVFESCHFCGYQPKIGVKND